MLNICCLGPEEPQATHGLDLRHFCKKGFPVTSRGPFVAFRTQQRENKMKLNYQKAMTAVIVLSMAYAGLIQAQEAPSDCVEMGAMAYDNWTKSDSGGAGTLPEGVLNQDYIRCKACHGWDQHRFCLVAAGVSRDWSQPRLPSATTVFCSSPRPSMATTMVSPGCTGPTPAGVPVITTSPGSSVMNSVT